MVPVRGAAGQEWCHAVKETRKCLRGWSPRAPDQAHGDRPPAQGSLAEATAAPPA